MERALNLAKQEALPRLEAWWSIELARLALRQGRLDAAEQCAAAALKIAKPREHWLNVFKAEWLMLQLARKRDPGSRQANRGAFLLKLLVRLGEHSADPDVLSFRKAKENETSGTSPRRGRS